MELKEVNFEQAKALKSLGFPQEEETVYALTDNVYDEYGQKYNTGDIIYSGSGFAAKEVVSAPSLELATEWLRETENIHIVPNFCPKAKKYEPVVYIPNRDGSFDKVMIPTYGTWSETISCGLNTILELLVPAKLDN